jgi:predicted Ser/Thr protein kinase
MGEVIFSDKEMAMVAHHTARALLAGLAERAKKEFVSQKNILSFEEYLELVVRNPRGLTRHAAQYLKDMIDWFGVEQKELGCGDRVSSYKVFERSARLSRAPIVGQEQAHESIYNVLEQFVRQGRVDKLILLHGPNGSSKTSTADALAAGLEEYSRDAHGAVYRFNWIFPTDKVGFDGLGDDGQAKRIGFSKDTKQTSKEKSFAHLSDEDVLCKIVSEMKENPLFLLPVSERVNLYKSAMKEIEGREISDADVPRHVFEGALGAKSKRIFDALMAAYNGDLAHVLRHVQVERFFFSARYRTGIACVEPQMHLDAQDRQLTLDRNVQNLPTVLQNIRIFEPSGELIDANRGFIEYSDLLKRPVDAFKYLLTTIETMSLNLSSGMADLDLIMMASANEKHLDAFKSSPDWPSFKGRFELVRVPYLLSVKQEQQIYAPDVNIIECTKKMGPHALELLARWAVLTRLKQPDPEAFQAQYRNLVGRVSPYDKIALFDGDDLMGEYSDQEKSDLRKLAIEVRLEGQKSFAYEGRFGASPREIKMVLYFASQNADRDSVSALSVFSELESLTSDRSVYEFLQFESSHGFHDYEAFTQYIKQEYARRFLREFNIALGIFDEKQYVDAFAKYLKQIVAFLKNEKVFNEVTHRNEPPDEAMMEEIEGLMGVSGEKKEAREAIVAKVAAWKVDHRDQNLDVAKLFAQELKTVEKNIYMGRRDHIQRIGEAFLISNSEDYKKLNSEIVESCENTYQKLFNVFGYTRQNAWESYVFAHKTLQ